MLFSLMSQNQVEPPPKPPRRTLTGLFFGLIAKQLEKSPKGREIVTHVASRIGFYSQAWSFTLTIALVILLRCTVVTAFYIPSPSMLDTLKINDRVFVFRLAYLFEKPKIGDIVVFKVPEDIPQYDPDKPIWIKRIVGIGGDHVEIVNNHLVVNGKKVSDPPFFRRNAYVSDLPGGRTFTEKVVPEGDVLVFGDNSQNSYDSRYWGPIHESRIIGRAFVRFWPLDRLGPIHGESVSPLPPGS
jgi:signal peptidase I